MTKPFLDTRFVCFWWWGYPPVLWGARKENGWLLLDLGRATLDFRYRR